MLEMLFSKPSGPVPTGSMNYQQFLIWLQNSQIQSVTARRSTEEKTLPIANELLFTYPTGQFLDNATMWGSPYSTRVTQDSVWNSISRHAFPSQAAYDRERANNRLVLLKKTATTSYPSYLSINRNGYQSLAYGSFGGFLITHFVYYDADTDLMRIVKPSEGLLYPGEVFTGVFP